MPRKLPPFVTRERTRHGITVFYFRVGKGKRTRLPNINDRAFPEAYRAALAGEDLPMRKVAGTNSLEWLITRYRGSSKYMSLSSATRRQRDNIFKGVIDASGEKPFRAVNRKAIVAGREKRAATPYQARHFLDAMRGLFRWALEADLVSIDPTVGVSNPSRKDSGGFAAWTEDDVLAYEAKWKMGTKERVWLHVLLYTGLRRGDAVRLGRQHVRDGVATLRTEKTGMEVSIPILPDLERTLKAGPTGDLAFIAGGRGQPLTKESFGNMFRVACGGAGVNKSAHGVRKIGATRAAEAGASTSELEALFGWTGGKMASLYTRTADRKRLAKQASERLKNAQSPHRHKQVRGKGEKRQ